MLAMFVLYSCSKTQDGALTKEQKEQQDKNIAESTIDDKDFTESVEDLTSVDYKEFYDQLAPHGEWIQVKPEEIGLQPKTASTNDQGNHKYSLSNLLCINDAFASSEADAAMVFVWKPSADIGVVRVEGESPVYVPYTNGQWVNTDAGWYFKAPTPVEETVSHYGRWINSPDAGWLWVPGRVWAPAWVDWKQNDNYVSWAPLPPSVYLINGTMSIPLIDDNNYLTVNRKYFLEPDIYKYNNLYKDDGKRVSVSEMTGTAGIVVLNNVIINRGPDVNKIREIYKRNIDLVKVQSVKNYKEVKYSDNVYNVYKPGFKRYKNKENTRITVIEPKSFKKYGEWKVKMSNDKDYKKRETNGMNNDGNDNRNNGNDKGKKGDGSEKGKKGDGSDKGKKGEGNAKGNKNGGGNFNGK